MASLDTAGGAIVGYMDSSGSCSTLSAALIAVRACSNECVAVALSTCLVGLRSLEDLGPWAIVLGRNGQGWLESGSVGGFDDLHGSSISKPVPPNQWPAATASLGVVLWLEPSEGRDGHAREVGLAEARRCLRPDGLLLVAEGNGEGCYSSDSDDGALEGDESSGDEAGASVEVKTGRLLAMGYHVHNSGNANAQKLKSSDSQSNDASVPQRNKSAVNEDAKLKVVRRYLTSKGDAWCLVAALRSGTSGSAPASGAAEPSTEGRATDSSSASTATPAVVAEATVTTVVSAVAGLSLNADLAASAGRRSSQPSVAPAVAVSMPAPLAWAAAAGTPGVAVRAEQRLLEAAAAWSARRAWAHGSRLSVQTPPPAAEVCGWEQAPLPSFLDAHDVYPQLATLQTPANFEAIQAEARKVAETGWKDWPEQHYSDGGLQDWKVFPFVHTFPADDPSATTFIASTCAACPKTASLLKSLGPCVRTALFSRLGPGARISSHRGWADLANHVLRCHLGLRVPPGQACAVWCDGEMAVHGTNEWLVFDDSKLHKAANESQENRFVLIVDLARPEGMAKGRAVGGRTPELNNLIQYFS